MTFETFSYYRQKEKSGKKRGVPVIDTFLDLLSASEPEPDCDVRKYISKDKQKFAIVLCCANEKDTNRIGRDIALNYGYEVMGEYLEQKKFYAYEVFGSLIYQWRNALVRKYGFFGSSEEKERFYRNHAPSFMAIAGDRNEILFVQCGQGRFMIEKDHKIGELYLDSSNEECYHTKGFATTGASLYFREFETVPEIAMMVSPYMLDNMKGLFREFSYRVSGGFTEREDKRDCLWPFIREIAAMEERCNVQTAIAGYVQHTPKQTPESGPAYSSQYTPKSGPAYGSQYTSQSEPGYGQKKAPKQKAASSWHADILKKQAKKQQEQRLQKLNAVKQNRYTLETELAQLKQMQSDMRKQEQNLEAEHEKTIEWVQAQKRYLASKEELNHYPND